MGRVGAMTLQKIKDNVKLNELQAPDGAVAMNSQKLTGLAAGSAQNDSMRKGQAEVVLADLEAAVCSETEADGKITTHKGDASAHHAKTSKASEITSEQFPVDRMPRAASGFLEGKGAGVNPAYSALVEADIPAHMAKSKLAFTANKILKGAGPGADPTEIDVPGGATKEFQVEVYYGGGGATEMEESEYHTQKLDAAGEYVRFNFMVPADFSTLTHCKIIGVKQTNGTMDWTAVTNFGALGEDADTHTDTDTADGVNMTHGILYGIDVSAALTGLAAGDVVGLKFTSDAFSAGGFLVILLDFKYE